MPLVNQCLQTWFDFPKNKIFCQVSTLANTSPHIRSMELYHVTSLGNVILLTDTSSRKWHDLEICPNIAICVVDVNYGQIIIEGTADLITSNNDTQTAELYWHHYLDQYWRDFYLSRTQRTQTISDSFGVIRMLPQLWEITEINKDDYLQSRKKQFLWREGAWMMSDLMLT
jgi:general stress protein 26